MRLEPMMLKSLIYNEEYFRKVIPFLKSEYFIEPAEKMVFDDIQEFANTYNGPPSVDALLISTNERNTLSSKEVDAVEKLLKEIEYNKDKTVQMQWILDKTEGFCKEKALFNAMTKSLTIMEGKDKVHDVGAIPSILSEALAVCFDSHVGHDYTDDAEERYDFFHTERHRIPFDLEYFNKITKGGIPPKTLNVLIAGINVGKSLALGHFAASYMVQGLNVLYITMEMAEEEIANRIDANLLNIAMDDLLLFPKTEFLKRTKKIREQTVGKLIIKEYPTAQASTTHFKQLVHELNLKKGFKPDVIIVDYLNICCSARIKMGSTVNSYTLVKSIAEELRGLAVELNVPVWTATQLTRTGFSSSDIDMDDTAESFGLPATADFMIGLTTSEELEALNQLMAKQLKSRYGNKSNNKRFVIGIDRDKMRLYDVEQNAQEDISDSGQKKEDKPLNTFGNRERVSKLKDVKFKV